MGKRKAHTNVSIKKIQKLTSLNFLFISTMMKILIFQSVASECVYLWSHVLVLRGKGIIFIVLYCIMNENNNFVVCLTLILPFFFSFSLWQQHFLLLRAVVIVEGSALLLLLLPPILFEAISWNITEFCIQNRIVESYRNCTKANDIIITSNANSNFIKMKMNIIISEWRLGYLVFLISLVLFLLWQYHL